MPPSRRNPNPEAAARLAARFLPTFRARGPSLVHWPEPKQDSDGVLILAYPELDGEVSSFLDALRREGWVHPFDWVAFADRARELSERPEALATASLGELRKLLTSVMRSEKFGSGAIAGAVESGLFARILERMQALGAEG